MRLAPTGDGKNDAYRDKLSRWAEISPYAGIENRKPPSSNEKFRLKFSPITKMRASAI
jgi:hypothetical protein